mgnify:CR=1 FL=1|jgi:27-O-demethylrifamycin SV methyltransferase
MSAVREMFESLVLPRMALTPGDRILDVGCGDGWACRALATLASQGMVVGIDASGDAIREARKLSLDFDNILYIQADAEENPWQDNFFSHALLIDSLGELRDMEAALRQLHRVLAPEGRVWIVGVDETAATAVRELLTRQGFANATCDAQIVSATM